MKKPKFIGTNKTTTSNAIFLLFHLIFLHINSLLLVTKQNKKKKFISFNKNWIINRCCSIAKACAIQYIVVYINYLINKKKNLPEDFNSSGETSSDKSGSSPYQNIHNSFAALRDSGGCVTVPILGPVKLISYIFPEGSGSGFGAATLRHTQSMSTARHLEYDRRTGSSRGSPDAFGRSPCTNLRHLMPQRSVCKQKI